MADPQRVKETPINEKGIELIYQMKKGKPKLIGVLYLGHQDRDCTKIICSMGSLNEEQIINQPIGPEEAYQLHLALEKALALDYRGNDRTQFFKPKINLFGTKIVIQLCKEAKLHNVLQTPITTHSEELEKALEIWMSKDQEK
jgi:hypothetical protein